jgi:hypothetical protein
VRLRTASGLALASLTAAVTVMAVDEHRLAGSTEAASLPHAVLVIEESSPAPHYPAWWECDETTTQDH